VDGGGGLGAEDLVELGAAAGLPRIEGLERVLLPALEVTDQVLARTLPTPEPARDERALGQTVEQLPHLVVALLQEADRRLAGRALVALGHHVRPSFHQVAATSSATSTSVSSATSASSS